jgi:peptide chain release factor 2
MNRDDFWKNSAKAKKKVIFFQELKKQVDKIIEIEEEIEELKDLEDILNDDKIVKEALKKYKSVKEKLVKLQNENEDPYNRSKVILQIVAGAGGVDAQDWAEMLLRMYLKFAEKNNLVAEIIAVSHGSEAGIKNALLEIKGEDSYSKLEKEAGVHRLVRLSPYNANNLRQTSFALVEVIPEVKEVAIKIEKKDLKIDTFHASGAGGQHVNTTDSAVRITHLPTGIKVICQNERSQLQNKEKAKKILEGKLYLLNKSEKKKQEKELKGEYKLAEWGNQIRSYIIHPYKMVKDHRSGAKSSKVEEFLDGDLEII